MTIALPSTTKRGLSGLLGRKRRETGVAGTKTTAEKQLGRHEVAKLFTQDRKATVAATPAKLNDTEKKDRDRLNSLRGALYSD